MVRQLEPPLRTEMQQCQRFVDELAPRLETARALERQLDAHLARRFNVFDYLRRDELGLSRIVADLLDPEGKHGQGASFLKLLLDGCRLRTASPEARTVEVVVEKAITDNRRLDICVRIDRFCLAIENKPYAGDQPDQVRDYLEWLRCNYEEYALIYLSRSGEPPSPESVKQTDLEGLDDASQFQIMSYHGTEEGEWSDGFDRYRCPYSLAEWFADCRKNCRADRLWWFLREAEEFCKQRFGGETVTNNEIDTIVDFVLSDKRNWEVGMAVHRALPAVIERVYSRLLEQVFNSHPKRTEYSWPEGVFRMWNYHSARTKSYLGMYRKIWDSDGSTHEVTQLRLEAESGLDRWSIGVKTEHPKLIGEDQECHRELREALENELGKSEAHHQGWVWWQWIDEEYQDWTSKILTLHEECEKGEGEVTTYFVEKFAEIAKVAVPIIDDVFKKDVGTDGATSQ